MKHLKALSGTFTLITALSLAGCGGSSETASSGAATFQGELVTYECKDGVTFTARLSDAEAIADLPDNPNLGLPRVESSSGAKYSDGTTTLWDKGGEAFVESNGEMILIDCQTIQAIADTSTQDSTQAQTEEPSDTTEQSTTVANANDPGIRTERVQFQPGSTSATVQDSITGYEGVDYVLRAQAGQYANISMATDNGANYFNILAPGETVEAMFIGSTSGNQYEGTLPATGDYRIRVYMMRSAARRNEVANYRLEMIISGQGSSSSVGNSTQTPIPSNPPTSSPETYTPTTYTTVRDYNAIDMQITEGEFRYYGTLTRGNGSDQFQGSDGQVRVLFTPADGHVIVFSEATGNEFYNYYTDPVFLGEDPSTMCDPSVEAC
jgi:membrane-bound inhibitor of C-type lysozyme